MENYKKVIINYRNNFAIIAMIILTLISMIVFSRNLWDELIIAGVVNIVNLCIVLFFQKKAFESGSYITWGLLFKGIKDMFLVVSIFLIAFLKCFENNTAFLLFFLGFFLVGFSIELVLLNYNKVCK